MLRPLPDGKMRSVIDNDFSTSEEESLNMDCTARLGGTHGPWGDTGAQDRHPAHRSTQHPFQISPAHQLGGMHEKTLAMTVINTIRQPVDTRA